MTTKDAPPSAGDTPHAGDDGLAVVELLCEERSRRLGWLMGFNGQAVLGAAAAAATLVFAHDRIAVLSTVRGGISLAMFSGGAIAFGFAAVMNWNHTFDHCRKLGDLIRQRTSLDGARGTLAEWVFPSGFGPLVFVAVVLMGVGALLGCL